MKRTSMATLWLCLLAAPAALAEPPVGVQMEVNFLLGFVEGSGCEFNRNASWYNSHAAQVHLRDKYSYLAARGQIATTEDFIAHAAAQSSMSGKPYLVRCHDAPTITSRQWLSDELVRLRAPR